MESRQPLTTSAQGRRAPANRIRSSSAAGQGGSCWIRARAAISKRPSRRITCSTSVGCGVRSGESFGNSWNRYQTMSSSTGNSKRAAIGTGVRMLSNFPARSEVLRQRPIAQRSGITQSARCRLLHKPEGLPCRQRGRARGKHHDDAGWRLWPAQREADAGFVNLPPAEVVARRKPWPRRIRTTSSLSALSVRPTTVLPIGW